MDDAAQVSHAIREQVTPAAVDALGAIEEPAERARLAADAVEAASHLRGALARVRKNAVLAMSEGGMTWADIGRELGTSGPRAHQIAHGRRR